MKALCKVSYKKFISGNWYKVKPHSQLKLNVISSDDGNSTLCFEYFYTKQEIRLMKLKKINKN